MPIKGDIKKDFLAMRDAVKGSLVASLRVTAEQILTVARRDGIIQDDSTETKFNRKMTKQYRIYKKIGQADMASKTGRIVFNHSKFISRTGNLLRSLTPSGGWLGNRLGTLGSGSVEVEPSGTKAKLIFEGKTEIILKGGKNAKKKDKVSLMDAFGKVVGSVGVRRRIIENATRSVSGLWQTALKKELDKRARAIK
jgi:hypothetical protein